MSLLANELDEIAGGLTVACEAQVPQVERAVTRLQEIARALRQDAPAQMALAAGEGAHRAAVELGAELASTGRHQASSEELALIAQTQALAAIAGAMTLPTAGRP